MDKQKKARKHIFTLVELLVVLLILGVLVGLAVPRYMDAQKNARFRTFTANVREIQSTLEVYRMDKTSTGPAEYPVDLSELTSYFTQPPINPYTGKSMLSDDPEESGLQYINIGSTYILYVVQPDVDDINKNDNTTEPLPVALNVGVQKLKFNDDYVTYLTSPESPDPVSVFGGEPVTIVDTNSQFCPGEHDAVRYDGKVVLIDRGGCSFGEKVGEALAAGASGVIIGDYDDDACLAFMGLGSVAETIPAVFISGHDKLKLRSAISAAGGFLQGVFSDE